MMMMMMKMEITNKNKLIPNLATILVIAKFHSVYVIFVAGPWAHGPGPMGPGSKGPIGPKGPSAHGPGPIGPWPRANRPKGPPGIPRGDPPGIPRDPPLGS